MQLPKRRTGDFIVKKLENETLVYDRATLQASCLNSLAADVWELCDGQRSIEEIAGLLSGTSADDRQSVEIAVEQLSNAQLLDTSAIDAANTSSASRRDMLRAIGWGAAAAIPAVVTIAVPTVADAASCIPAGSPCDIQNPGACCSQTCGVNVEIGPGYYCYP